MKYYKKYYTQLKNNLVVCIVVLLIGISGISQESSSVQYYDTINSPKKEINKDRQLVLALSTHEYDVRYKIGGDDYVQYEVASSLKIGYQFLDEYYIAGVFAMKGFHHYIDQPQGQGKGGILSNPWIIDINAGVNLFYFRKRKFFLGPIISYKFLYDNKYKQINHLGSAGVYLRKKWFTFQVLFHGYIYSKNDQINIYDEKSISRSIGVLIPISKIKNVKKESTIPME